ncbi:archease, partial [bacterium]|nr:archease [bacterium]
MKKYETFDHTADLGIRVFGKTREELFANAGYAMFDIL